MIPTYMARQELEAARRGLLELGERTDEAAINRRAELVQSIADLQSIVEAATQTPTDAAATTLAEAAEQMLAQQKILAAAAEQSSAEVTAADVLTKDPAAVLAVVEQIRADNG